MDENINIQISESGSPEVSVSKSKKSISIQDAIIANAVIIGAAVIVAALILTHGTITSKTDTTTAQAPGGGAAQVLPPDISKIKVSSDPYIGNPNAKVRIAYWSDYQCPFCKMFETTTLKNIVKNYVDKGTVAVVFKDFSFLGPDSDTAALYGRAIWQLYPAQYFAWRTAMFDAQDKENSGFGDEPSVIKLTTSIQGIDVSKVQKLLAEKTDEFQKAIDADKAEGASFGVQGTPAMITGMTLFPGVTDYATFAKALDAQLK